MGQDGGPDAGVRRGDGHAPVMPRQAPPDERAQLLQLLRLERQGGCRTISPPSSVQTRVMLAASFRWSDRYLARRRSLALEVGGCVGVASAERQDGHKIVLEVGLCLVARLAGRHRRQVAAARRRLMWGRQLAAQMDKQPVSLEPASETTDVTAKGINSTPTEPILYFP